MNRVPAAKRTNSQKHLEKKLTNIFAVLLAVKKNMTNAKNNCANPKTEMIFPA
jgi:hypothetical protein